MSLHLHHATRTDLLADGLAALLARPLADPFAEEVVVVPAKGVERWLTQRLSHRLGAGPGQGDGVCAGVRFLNPRSLVALLTGTEDHDQWDPDRLVWPLLRVVDASLGEPWCATLARHLGHEVPGERGALRRDRQWSVVRRLAGLFASYAVQRPALLTDWGAGRDTDGAGAALPEDLRWQAELWRRLVAATATPPPDERHVATLAAIRAGAPLALPDRLSLFGHTRLPVTELELLRAVAEVREVHLWLPQASPAAWETLRAAHADGPVRRREDDTGFLLRHRLLVSLGRDTRELQRSLALLGDVTEEALPDPPAEPATLLGRLQHSLRADDNDVAGVPSPFPDGDRSVQVHACHGPARQVEVLREVLVGLLQDDPTLEPRDILVMCPDVEAYAPLFSACFGLAKAVGPDGHPGHRLRVRLADRGLGSTNPLLALALALVRLAGGRATASEVLDLASSDPVRHRFGLDEDDLAELAGWVRRSGVRWGLDATSREPFGLHGVEENTWRAGLDRVLLGVAAAEGDVLLGGRLPLDDVGSSGIELAGRLAELVERLRRTVAAFTAARTVPEWARALRAGVTALGSVPPRDAWQQAQLDRELDGLLAAATGARTGAGSSYDGSLTLTEVRTLLEVRLEPRPTRANFRTGHLTVCTMVPMRSVPHRVVCLVGLDDGVFPRGVRADGDDVLLRDPLTGERDPRSEDRQLLLDAILAARETLVLTYTGASVTNNQELPPAVPVDEVLDALEAVTPGAREHVVRRQPLQPFDPRCFDPASASAGSFDRPAAAAARVVQGERPAPERFLASPLPPLPAGDVELADLQSFLRSPVAGFLAQRLDVGLPQDLEEVSDAVPLSLGSLEEWAVGDRILRRLLDADDAERVLTGELLRGDLPPRGLGRLAVQKVCTRVQALHDASQEDRRSEPTSIDVTVDLGGGRRLTGVVPDVRGDRIVRAGYSKLGPKQRLAAWVDLLALSAAFPDRSWTASVHGWSPVRNRDAPARSVLGPVDDAAITHLAGLVDVRDRGLCEPLPLFQRTSAAWADAARRDRDGAAAAHWAWTGSFGEQHDPAHVRVHGAGAALDRLLGQPRDGEEWNEEPTRLGRYALHVWAPLLACERRTNL